MIDRIEFNLPTGVPGTQRTITAFRLGNRRGGPSVYIQAALHADELNGTLVVDALRGMLENSERQNELSGEVWLVPLANPLGLGQHLAGRHLGRFHLETNENFNRHFPKLDFSISEVELLKSTKTDARRPLIKAMLAKKLEGLVVHKEVDSMRRQLLLMSLQADIILDLHCEDRGNLHLYLSSPPWEHGRDLAAFVAAQVVLLNRIDPENLSFSEATAYPWLRARALGLLQDAELPTVATIELRGRGDSNIHTVKRDSEGIFNFLASRGVLDINENRSPGLACEPSILEAMDVGYAPLTGVVLPHFETGDRVAAGDTVVTIVDAIACSRTPIRARGSGILFALKAGGSLALEGQAVFRIAGSARLDHRLGKSSVDD